MGAGSGRPRWLVVGAAPDENEDQNDALFEGPSGRLLDAMLHAVGANRHDDVFLATVLKCHSPRPTDLSSSEAAKCRPYLARQIQLLRPELILAVGGFAAQALLATDEAFERLRGRVHSVDFDALTVPVVVSFDPADLLQRPADKAGAWSDLCLARSVVPPLRD